MTVRIVAGVGNVLRFDDGFGVEVARGLGSRRLPPATRVVDASIGSVHLAYELLDDCERLVLIDAINRGNPPGTPIASDGTPETLAQLGPVDGHASDPAAVLSLLARLGGRPPRTFVVACEAAMFEEGSGYRPPSPQRSTPSSTSSSICWKGTDMHEYGMCEAIVDAVVARANDRPVEGVRIRVGALHRVEPVAFQQAFAAAASGTAADGATAEVVVLPVRCRCTECQADYEGSHIPVTCPACQGGALEVVGGDELVVESIRFRTARG